MHALRSGSSGSDPFARSQTAHRITVDVAQVDRARAVIPIADPLAVRGHAGVEVGKLGRCRQACIHRDLVVGSARFLVVEAGLQVEDGSAVLDRHHASGGKASTIPDPVDLVQNGPLRVARAQEVRVQRVDVTIRLVDGSTGSDQRLAGDLSAEHPQTVLIGRRASEDVHLDRLEVEQRHEIIECLLVVLLGRDVGIRSHEVLMLPRIDPPMQVRHPVGVGAVTTAT